MKQIGKRYFQKLLLDNYDGKSGEYGAENWREVKVEANPGNRTELQ